MEAQSLETLLVAVTEAAPGRQVVTITLNRPEVGNALSPVMARELSDVAIACDDDPAVAAVVLTGAGKLFCAGGDLSVMAAAGDRAPSVVKGMAGDLHMAISRFTRMAAPTIAAVGGTAGGAGFSLMMATDLAIVSDKARFTLAYTAAGLSPDGSSTFFLPRRLGERRARELMLTNRMLSAAEAEAWGLVNEVVAPEQVLSRASALAEQLATGPTQAFGAVKSLLNESHEHGLEAQMELESRAIAAMAATDDGKEGIQAFLEKRAPSFKGS
ncbi:MAG: enoyl-CoA hydratase-related protein [Pseudomonadota bacterium]